MITTMTHMAMGAIACLFISAQAETAADSETGQYIYASTSDNRAMVFNTRTHHLNFVDKRSSSITADTSEFAGSFVDCTDAKYYCIGGPIDIVIPKHVTGLEWTHKHSHCNARYVDKSKEYDVKCWSPYGKRNRVICVRYSRTYGVLSFRSLAPTKDSAFKLRGRYGLFSNPTDSK